MPAGYEGRASFTRDADLYTRTWPSLLGVTPTSILPLLAETVTLERQYQSVAEKGVVRPPIVIRISGGGDVLVACHYHGLEFMLACLLGFQAKRIGSTVMPEALGGGAFRHLFEIDRDLHAEGWQAGEGWIAGDAELLAGLQKLRRGIYTADKGVDAWNATSSMAASGAFNSTGTGVALSVNLVSASVSIDALPGSLAGLTQNNERLIMNDMVFKLGTSTPFGGDAVLSEMTGFTLNIDNNLEVQFTKDGANVVDEPTRSSPVSVNGSFSLPIHDSRFAVEYQDQLPMIGLIEFVGNPIGGSGENYTFRIYMPSVIITSMDVTLSGPERIQQNYNFTCSVPASNPTGFPANVKGGPVMVELINNISAHPLIT